METETPIPTALHPQLGTKSPGWMAEGRRQGDSEVALELVNSASLAPCSPVPSPQDGE